MPERMINMDKSENTLPGQDPGSGYGICQAQGYHRIHTLKLKGIV